MPAQYDRIIGGSRLLHSGYECYSPEAPSDFDRLVSGYRLIGGPLLYLHDFDPLPSVIVL